MLDKIFINGEWVASEGKDTIDVVNPTTTEVIGAVPAGDTADVDRAVSAARAACPPWARTTAEERATLLDRVSATINDHTDELADLAATDIGTPLAFGRFMHAQLPATTFADMADRIRKTPLVETNGKLVIRREPVGVVGAITPWNYPAHQIAAKIAPALASGSVVVLKPSEVAPLSAWRLIGLLDEAGVPAGVVNMISGYGPIVGEALAAHDGVDMVSFTGSVAAGRRVGELAGRGIKRVTLELGGKSATVVLPDVGDIGAIVDGALKSSISNAGQTCSALSRLVVPSSRLAEVEERLAATAASIRVGDPKAEGVELGPIVSSVQYERVRSYVEVGLAEGAELVAGGVDKPIDQDGYFVAPTVFSKVTPDMRINQEEIFGPVLSVLPYETEDEALEIANSTLYGLSGSVWSATVEHGQAFAGRMRTGQVKINGGAFNPTAPFGGFGQSGVGRELGEFGLQEYFEIKALTL